MRLPCSSSQLILCVSIPSKMLLHIGGFMSKLQRLFYATRSPLAQRATSTEELEAGTRYRVSNMVPAA